MTNNESSMEHGPRIGIAPDSWGVWNAVDTAQPLATQYLREISEAGYHFTELGPYGYLGTDQVQLRDAFAEHDLSLSGGTIFTGLHTGMSAVAAAWAQVREVASLTQALGGEHLIVIPQLWDRASDGNVIGNRDFTVAEWNLFLAGHDTLGKRLLEEFGLKQQFHSHAESPVGSYSEVVRLLDGTDSNFVNLCLDTGHFAYYHGDILRLINAHPDRIGYLHLKQVAPDILADVLKNDIDFATAVQRGVMVEPPFGEPAYAPILEAANRHTPGIFAIIEQDMYPLKDFDEPRRIAERTHQYISACGTPARFR